MAISPQLPQIVSPARPGGLQALALQAGQVLEAKIIGPAPNGGTQVQIAGQLLNLLLPMLTQAGETLQLQVQGSGAQIKLVVQPQAPASAQAPAQPLPPTATSMPVVSVTVQSAAATSVQAGNPKPGLLQAAAPASQPTGAAGPVAPQFVQARPVPAGSAILVEAGRNATPQAPAQAGAPSVAIFPSTVATGLTSAPVFRPGSTPYPMLPQAAAETTQSSAALVQSAQTKAISEAVLLTSSVPTASPTSQPSQPSSPQAALAQMVQSALPHQDSIGHLMSSLGSLAGKVAVPEPVARAVQQVLAGQLPLGEGKLNGSALQRAVLNSGVFQETKLALGQVPTAQTDQKSALLALRQTLVTWLGPQPQAAPVAPIPPPLRGQVPRARNSETQPVEPAAAPQEHGKRLLEQTDAALSRLRLHQSAALPDPAVKTADWSMDLPVIVGQQQTVLHLQIHRDAEEPTTDVPERGWQMRFALSLPHLGEVGAQVSLRAGTTGVMLWAAERETSEALEAHISALRQTFADIGLRPGAMIVRHGEPPGLVHNMTTAGHFLDSRT